MSLIPRHEAVRSRGVPWAPLVLALGGVLVTSGGALAGPPEPVAIVEASCQNDDLGDGNWSPRVELDIDASFKGRWVDFEWSASVDTVEEPKGTTETRWDSRVPFRNRVTFLATEPATTAHAGAVIVDRKGRHVGGLIGIEVPCTTPA